jgi:ribosomal protein S12 methylthiotransferase accessory factor
MRKASVLELPARRQPAMTQVVGSGRLAAAMAAALGVPARAEPDLVADCEGAVVVHVLPGWSATSTVDISKTARVAGSAVLQVRVDGSLGFVGPLLPLGGRGCAWCAEAWRRRLLGETYPADLATVTPPPRAVAPALLDALAAVAKAALVDTSLAARLVGGVYVVRGTDMAGRLHRFLPYPSCPLCDERTNDDPRTVSLQPRPQADPQQLRAGQPLTAADMRAQFGDWRYGPVAHVWRDEQSPLCLVTAEMVRASGARIGGYGRDVTYPDSERVALFEAFERAASSAPSARRTVVTGSYRDLAADAIDPRQLGLPEPEFLAGTPYVPYHDAVSTHWVWGWSFGQGRAVLVPEHVAYWQAPPRAGSARLVYESSNGCALGASLEEALLYGLFEVIERDAFLLAWHARLALPRLDPDLTDVALGHLMDRLEADGFSLLLFDMSLDHPIPAILSLALADDPIRVPQAFFAAGAHPDPDCAARAAVAEVVTNTLLYQQRRALRPQTYDPQRLRPMLTRPGLVRVLDDHVALYTLPEARGRYAHLLHDAPARPLIGAYGDWRARWCRPDLTEVLVELLADFDRRNLEVIVVDVSDPVQQRRLGLHAVKVIVAGTLPMTFGHANRRLRHLTRLTTVPTELGYPAALTTDPHPFP